MNINPLKGVHDLINDEAFDWDSVIDMMKKVFNAFGYSYIQVPTIEMASLYSREGDSSDVVRKEMYQFHDKGNRLISLRPEFTAGIIRAIISNKLYVNDKPLKYFYYGPCFRYERPQAGRYREFNQIGVEFIDEPSLYNDVEVIRLAYILPLAFGIKARIKLNYLPAKESRENYIQALKEYFQEHLDKMCPDCHERYERNALRILDCKVPSCQEIVKGAPKISDYLSKEEREDFRFAQELLKELNVNFYLDDNLVRGLDYYSGLVFEITLDNEEGESLGSIGGGGHYDKLVSELGGPSSLEGVGFSYGLERFVSLARLYSFSHPDYHRNRPLIVYAPLCLDAVHDVFDLSMKTRNKYLFRSAQFYRPISLKSALRFANKVHAPFIVLIGEDELNENVVTFKNLLTGRQEQINKDDYLNVINNVIADGLMEAEKEGKVNLRKEVR